ncbi:hypothetical protein ABZ942_40605 [Nocardia sp. NPDC046473]|uniref:hypothetical protein n=1 Tax=Nocardia sp. NPDC046473 TaxID=3155733 RepID=UPI0033EE9F3D
MKSTKRVRRSVRCLGVLATVAAAALVGTPAASAEVVGIETWDEMGTGKVAEVHAGTGYYFKAVMGGTLQTYGWVYFYDNGQAIPNPWYPGSNNSDIVRQNGRYEAVSFHWTPKTTGNHTIRAIQCANGCSYVVNELSVVVVVT